ncbi:MAG: hypothetical protein DMG13_09230 [Acidobacteria bacterium]|nr:MAG: hypothetical protein DMG13_09230 [Acidobacteriota bacterium]
MSRGEHNLRLISKRDIAGGPRSASTTARSLKRREAQARQRAASKDAKRKRDSAQPQKTRSASATARSLKKIERRYSTSHFTWRGSGQGRCLSGWRSALAEHLSVGPTNRRIRSSQL